jgi:hypothetical protein
MRRGTSAEWREYGDICVPLEAEICVELMQFPDGTVNKNVGVKVGNGIDSYEQLPYVILNEESDPTVPDWVKEITQENIENWNGCIADLEQEIQDRINGDQALQDQIDDLKLLEGNDVNSLQIQIDQNKNDISNNADAITDLKNEFDNHDHALNDLSDVNAVSPTRDDLIVWNGSTWEANDFKFIQTALRFKGGIAPTDTAPANPAGGDLYVFESSGTVSSSWGAIAGREVQAGKFVGYAADTHNRWFLLGDMAEIGVTDVSGGIGIHVDDSKPSQPVVNIDRTETDKWYEPKFAKNTAFNKNFGTTNGTVAQGNHTHSQYLTSFTEKDPTVPGHVKSISQADINKWNNPPPGGTTLPNGSSNGEVLVWNGSSWTGRNTLTVAASPPGGATFQGYVTSSGWKVSGSNDSAVVLAGGGTKPLSDFNTGSGPDMSNYYTKTQTDANFATKSHTHSYVPLSGNSTISGTLTATDFVANSDIALKQNVKTAPLGLLDQIRGVEFEWKDGKEASGVIANEIEKILPHLVSEQDGIKSVHMMGLLAYIIEEIKALKNG